MKAIGCVFLAGAGPGDPELLTLRACRLLREADVVVYDRLVAPEILELARPDAERIYVGKEPNGHLLPQARINDLLVRLACEGKRVVRLKGGDPFVFGRGGEEAEALAAHGVPFEVVPGVTAACGVAAGAGIPLTHRDHAHACVLVTGHLKDGSIDIDWEALARPRQTLAIYMGLAALPVVCRELVAHGLTPGTPAAVIQQGTTPGERVVVGSLADLPQRVAVAGLEAPALIIVGEVVRLRAVLARSGAAAGKKIEPQMNADEHGSIEPKEILGAGLHRRIAAL